MRSYWREFIPKSIIYLKDYSWSIFRKDLIAGITVGITALPLAMAFAIASGVSPERGIFTAIVAGFLISALGGSKVQIGGPTGAFVVIVSDIIIRNGYQGLALSTLIAAVFLVVMGLCRIGSWIKYVPYPLVVGFTTGIAVIIFSTQVKDFFGLSLDSVPVNFLMKWAYYVRAFPTLHLPSFAIGASTLGLILTIRRYCPRIPWGIAAIVFATLLSQFLDLPVQTIESHFGALPRTLLAPSIPSFSVSFEQLRGILFDALAIALLGGLESLLSCVVADGMTGARHKSNCELFSQGIANLGSILFGGIPATGAIARTAANVKTGAQTPMAGMIHAVVLFLIILFFAPIVSKIPLAALAAILIMVAWNMSELPHFFHLLRAPASDRAVLLTAFLLTVFVDIVYAVVLGMVLSCFLFMRRMSSLSRTANLTTLFEEPKDEVPDSKLMNVPPDVEIFEINGPFFFGAADLLQELDFQKPPRVFILRMRKIPLIDASGAYALTEFICRYKRQGTILYLSGVQESVKHDLCTFGVINLIGEDAVFPDIDAALKKANLILQ